jgi:hypothetical protein
LGRNELGGIWLQFRTLESVRRGHYVGETNERGHCRAMNSKSILKDHVRMYSTLWVLI